jgi:hypothetical protein
VIIWAKKPVFKLISNEGQYNVFECIEDGLATYGDVALSFEVGWATDFTSSPLWARSFLPQVGAHAPASLIHDRALSLGLPRHICRAILNDQLKLLQMVSKKKRIMILCGVWLYDMCLKFNILEEKRK